MEKIRSIHAHPASRIFGTATGFGVALWVSACSGDSDQTQAWTETSPNDGSPASPTNKPSSTPDPTDGPTDGPTEAPGDSSDDPTDGPDEPDTGSNTKFDLGTAGEGSTDTGGEGSDCDEPLPPPDLSLTGKVFAPNGTIPISGALVYTVPAGMEINGIPEDHVYCDECVEIPCYYHTLTNPDGTFTLDANFGDDQKLVIQKGQFMRIVDIDIDDASPDTALDASMTTFPSRWDPDQGHYIPKIAVTVGPYDRVHDVLGKMGLGEVTATGELAFGAGERGFAVYGSSATWEAPLGGVLGTGLDLLNNLEEMNKYHIIFIPCGSEIDMAPAGPLSLGTIADATRDNIRSWVAAGGKLYVTDDAQEYITEPFLPYQTFFEVEESPDLPSAYSSESTILDADMLAWLQALPPALANIGQGEPTLANLPQVTVEGAWSAIKEVHSVTVDSMGDTVEVGHKVWVEGPVAGGVVSAEKHPLTVTGTYGCGRIMFSDYHTGDSVHTGANPQELLLLYLIIEIGVCAENPVPPPPIG